MVKLQLKVHQVLKQQLQLMDQLRRK